eukprot:TRINITY_DN2767_c0_g1_i5.p3 TRINITY_DN2767_c0_g1~~TRINITY_DN2767_c0_g1_i5.p3  ORF type:complete len:178 (-),score=58.15 TRINITY_DN2767_c0_g1_i5:737-1270(-)
MMLFVNYVVQDDIDTLRRNPAARAASPVPDQVKPTPAAITAASARRKRAAPSAATTTTAAAVVTTTTTTTAHPVTTTQGGAQQPQQQQQPQQHRVPVASLMQELTTVPSTMVLATPAQTIQTMEPAAAAPAATQERGRPRKRNKLATLDMASQSISDMAVSTRSRSGVSANDLLDDL